MGRDLRVAGMVVLLGGAVRRGGGAEAGRANPPARGRALAGRFGTFILDPEGRVAWWGTTAEQLLGQIADDVVGRHAARRY